MTTTYAVRNGAGDADKGWTLALAMFCLGRVVIRVFREVVVRIVQERIVVYSFVSCDTDNMNTARLIVTPSQCLIPMHFGSLVASMRVVLFERVWIY